MAEARRTAVAAALLVAVGGLPAEAALEPHRAAYRLSLARHHQATPLLEVRGGLVIEWQLVCDGWLSHQRLGFVAATEEGGSIGHDVRFSSWEAADGSRLRYTIRSYDGDAVKEEYRGEAWVDGAGGGTARFTAPQPEDVPLPPGTIFPTDHLQRVLQGAREKQRLVSHEVFDGWGLDALTQITTVIGRPENVTLRTDEVADPRTGRAWPVSMAYYNIARQDNVPEFEAEFQLTEQGVLRDLELDYGDFRLDAKLEHLEFLDRPDC